MEKPDFSWENLKVGMIIGERDIILTQDSLSNYCDSLGIQETFYSTDSPYQNPIAPPMIFVNDLLAIYDQVLTLAILFDIESTLPSSISSCCN